MIPPVAPIGFDAAAPATSLAPAPAPPATSFADLLRQGVSAVEAKVGAADGAVRAFVLDDSVPVHRVSYALEEARLSLELMIQVRNRLVDSYQQLMTMQM